MDSAQQLKDLIEHYNKEREALHSKWAEFMVLKSDEQSFVDDQFEALVEELRDTTVQKNVYKKRVTQLERTLDALHVRKSNSQGAWSGPARLCVSSADEPDARFPDQSVHLVLHDAILVAYKDRHMMEPIHYLSCEHISTGQELGERVPQVPVVTLSNNAVGVVWRIVLDDVPEFVGRLSTMGAMSMVNPLVGGTLSQLGAAREASSPATALDDQGKLLEAVVLNLLACYQRGNQQPQETPTFAAKAEERLEAALQEIAKLKHELQETKQAAKEWKVRVGASVNKLKATIVSERQAWDKERAELLGMQGVDSDGHE